MDMGFSTGSREEDEEEDEESSEVRTPSYGNRPQSSVKPQNEDDIYQDDDMLDSPTIERFDRQDISQLSEEDMGVELEELFCHSIF